MKSDVPAVQESRRAGMEAIDVLHSTTVALVNCAKQGIEHAYAVAVPYLMLAGTVIGGWMMAKTHAIAVERAAEDPEFYASKRQLARFYVDHVLPQALAHAAVVERGSNSVVDADAALL
jgi:3-(methylthio)propanoyl-CoA dehydrogenase